VFSGEASRALAIRSGEVAEKLEQLKTFLKNDLQIDKRARHVEKAGDHSERSILVEKHVVGVLSVTDAEPWSLHRYQPVLEALASLMSIALKNAEIQTVGECRMLGRSAIFPPSWPTRHTPISRRFSV